MPDSLLRLSGIKQTFHQGETDLEVLRGVDMELMEGEIVAVGTGARNEKGEVVALDVKAGDRVLFGKWSGTEVKIDGEELLIMKESDIMGIIETSKKAKKAA